MREADRCHVRNCANFEEVANDLPGSIGDVAAAYASRSAALGDGEYTAPSLAAAERGAGYIPKLGSVRAERFC